MSTAYDNNLRSARRRARSKGYVLTKILMQDSITVLECSVCPGACTATKSDLEHGHWRSRSFVFEGSLDEVTDWLKWPHKDADLETFLKLNQQTRALVLRLIDSPNKKDLEELHAHPSAQTLASWLLELPAYGGGA